MYFTYHVLVLNLPLSIGIVFLSIYVYIYYIYLHFILVELAVLYLQDNHLLCHYQKFPVLCRREGLGRRQTRAGKRQKKWVPLEIR